MKRNDELLLKVVERFLFHSEKSKSDNPMVANVAKIMCDIEIWEMWTLTQN